MKKQAARVIEIDISKCTGCRACEIACSFHFYKEFDPAKSTIHVYRDNQNGEIEITFNSACDYCVEEKLPLCVEFCETKAIKIKASRKNHIG